MNRRAFLLTTTAALSAATKKMTPKERIDRALKGEDVDRPPFSFWHHFGLQDKPASAHAQATLDFQRKFRTDLVKVMSDFPYPKNEKGVLENPFPEQIRALEIIRDGLAGNKYFVETIFNPWNQAEKTSSKEEVQRLKQSDPQVLLDRLEVIAKSEANHARRAIQTGASGIFLAIANAGDGILSREEYIKFSEPFDRMVLDAVKDAPLNILHLHGHQIWLERFYQGWPVTAINHSWATTGVSIAEFRKHYAGPIIGGIDEVNFRKLGETELKLQWHSAQDAAGKKFILAPGCSVPDDSTDDELLRLTRVVGA